MRTENSQPIRSDSVWCVASLRELKFADVILPHKFEDKYGLVDKCVYCLKTKEEVARRPYKQRIVVDPSVLRSIPTPPRFVPKNSEEKGGRKRRNAPEAD